MLALAITPDLIDSSAEPLDARTIIERGSTKHAFSISISIGKKSDVVVVVVVVVVPLLILIGSFGALYDEANDVIIVVTCFNLLSLSFSCI